MVKSGKETGSRSLFCLKFQCQIWKVEKNMIATEASLRNKSIYGI